MTQTHKSGLATSQPRSLGNMFAVFPYKMALLFQECVFYYTVPVKTTADTMTWKMESFFILQQYLVNTAQCDHVVLRKKHFTKFSARSNARSHLPGEHEGTKTSFRVGWLFEVGGSVSTQRHAAAKRLNNHATSILQQKKVWNRITSRRGLPVHGQSRRFIASFGTITFKSLPLQTVTIQT